MLNVHRYIRTLSVKNDDLIGIMAVLEARTQVVRLTFSDEVRCSNFLSQHEGVITATIDNREMNILIKDSNVEEKFVRLHGVSHDFNLELVKQRFNKFGKVLSVRWEKFQNLTGDDEVDFFPVKSTWIIVRMTLETPIPSYVNLGEYHVTVRYNGQTPTCRECDKPGHMGRDCPTLVRNRKQVTVNEASVSVGQENTTANQQTLVNPTQTMAQKEPEIVQTEMPVLVPVQKEPEAAAVVRASVSLENLNAVDDTVMETQVVEETQLSASCPLSSTRTLSGSTGSISSQQPESKKKKKTFPTADPNKLFKARMNIDISQPKDKTNSDRQKKAWNN